MSVFDHYAAYYDLLYRDKNYQQEAQYIQQAVAAHGAGSGSLLELGCGTGKHAACFADLGYTVHGVDLSPNMVQEAQQRAAGATNRTFSVGDIRSVRLDRQFNVVASLFHVISYQVSNADLAAAFATAAAHLQENGVFFFDFWHGPGVLTDPPHTRVKRLSDERIHVTRLAEPVLDAGTNRVDVHYEVWVDGPGEQRAVIRETHPMRYLFLPELELLLHQAGFRQLQFSAWLSDRKPGYDDWYACCVARK